MIGIYKITSPNKKIYIGQSSDIEKRFYHYKILKCKRQPKVYNSLLKYGFEKHKFEILCECEFSELNEKERYYQDLYSCTNRSGLNCVLVNSKENKMIVSCETRLKMSKSQKGKNIPQKTRDKMSESGKKKVFTAEHKENIRLSQIGSVKSKEARENMRKSRTGGKGTRNRKVLDTKTGIIYDSIKSTADINKLSRSTLVQRLSGALKNNTNFIYTL